MNNGMVLLAVPRFSQAMHCCAKRCSTLVQSVQAWKVRAVLQSCGHCTGGSWSPLVSRYVERCPASTSIKGFPLNSNRRGFCYVRPALADRPRLGITTVPEPYQRSSSLADRSSPMLGQTCCPFRRHSQICQDQHATPSARTSRRLGSLFDGLDDQRREGFPFANASDASWT